MKNIPEELQGLELSFAAPIDDHHPQSVKQCQDYVRERPGSYDGFFGAWEKSEMFGQDARHHPYIKPLVFNDPQHHWQGFFLRKEVLSDAHQWDRELIDRLSSVDERSIRFADNNTCVFLFDEKLREPVFVLLASYLTPPARRSYYDAAKKYGFISPECHKQIVERMPGIEPITQAEIDKLRLEYAKKNFENFQDEHGKTIAALTEQLRQPDLKNVYMEDDLIFINAESGDERLDVKLDETSSSCLRDYLRLQADLNRCEHKVISSKKPAPTSAKQLAAAPDNTHSI